MNALYPIIRRVRRPLLPPEPMVEAVPKTEAPAPVPAPATATPSAAPETEPPRKSTNKRA